MYIRTHIQARARHYALDRVIDPRIKHTHVGVASPPPCERAYELTRARVLSSSDDDDVDDGDGGGNGGDGDDVEDGCNGGCNGGSVAQRAASSLAGIVRSSRLLLLTRETRKRALGNFQRAAGCGTCRDIQFYASTTTTTTTSRFLADTRVAGFIRGPPRIPRDQEAPCRASFDAFNYIARSIFHYCDSYEILVLLRKAANNFYEILYWKCAKWCR